MTGWPERPTCHDNGPHYGGRPFAWEEPHADLEYGRVEGFRTCNYCGSIHPGDLHDYLESGVASLHGSDWKYGWPHKFYVEGIPNLFSGDECRVGSHHVGGVVTPILGKPSKTAFAKFYSVHLMDAGYDPPKLTRLCQLIETSSGIRFQSYVREDGTPDLRYLAPCRGYQR